MEPILLGDIRVKTHYIFHKFVTTHAVFVRFWNLNWPWNKLKVINM
jgi:hypothetical protein